MKLHPSLIPFVTLLITSTASADDRAIGYYRFPAIHIDDAEIWGISLGFIDDLLARIPVSSS